MPENEPNRVESVGSLNRSTFLTTLKARPLLALLPFYIAGLCLGPKSLVAKNFLWPAALSGTVVFAVWVLKNRRRSFIPAAISFFLIGAASTASVYSPPTAPHHVYFFRGQPDLVFGGRVAQGPEVSYGRSRLVVSAREVMSIGGEPKPARGRVYLTVPSENLRCRRGDFIRFPAALREISSFANPGAFDFRAYQAARGIWVQGYIEDGRLLTVIENPDELKSPLLLLDRFRERSARLIDQTVGQPARGLIKTMLLGIRDDIDPDLEEALRKLGLAHLLSISGLHVGLVALISYWLILKMLLLWPDLALRVNLIRVSALASLAPVIIYTGLAGAGPPTLRAALMVSLFGLDVLLGRRRDNLTALAAAAWVILVLQPGAVFSISFQLSFAAVGAILLLAGRFRFFSDVADNDAHQGSTRMFKRSAARVAGMAGISIAAFLGTAPIIAAHFNYFPLLTLPANLVLTPVITMIIIPPGFLGLLLLAFFPQAAALVFLIMERLIWLVLPTVEYAAAWPGVNPMVRTPGPVFIVSYYLLLTVIFLVRPFKRAVLVSGAIVIALAPVYLFPIFADRANPGLSVTFLDVGQGNAAHVSLPDGTEMMIDGGGIAGSDFDVGERVLAPYLLHQGVTRVDILALSHPQLDHYGGFIWLADKFKPGEFWSNHERSDCPAYRGLIKKIETRGLKQPGLDELLRPRKFGAAEVQALYPPWDFLNCDVKGGKKVDYNDNSLVLKIRLGRISFLFPGDLETAGEAELIRLQGLNLQSDVLLASHHGGRSSLSTAFLEMVRPRYIVFSAGRKNRLNMPSPEALARAEGSGARILRTDRDGAVLFETDGSVIQVKTWRRD